MPTLDYYLNKRLGLKHAFELAAWVGADQERYHRLWVAITTAQEPHHRRAAYAWEKLVADHPYYLETELADIIHFVLGMHLHPPKKGNDAVLRHLCKMLYKAPLTEEVEGAIFEWGGELLTNPRVPIAVHVHVFYLLTKIARPYSELQQELRELVAADFPHHRTPAFRACVRKAK